MKKLLDTYSELADQSLRQLSNLNHTNDNQLFLWFKESIDKLRDPHSAPKSSVSSRQDNYGSASKRSSDSFDKSADYPRKLSVKKPDLIIDEVVQGYQPKAHKGSSDEAPLQLAERKKSSDSSSNIDFKKKKKKKYVRNFQDSQ